MKARYVTTIMAALVMISVAGAQDMKQGGGEREGKTVVEGNTLLYIQTLIHTFDTDGNLTVEEDELEKGFLAILQKQEARHKMLLKLFDADKDGTLNQKEAHAARKFAFGLAGLLRYDNNQDWTVDEAESDVTWTQMTDTYGKHNQFILATFDKDKNGTMSPEEIAAAHKQFREWHAPKN